MSDQYVSPTPAMAHQRAALVKKRARPKRPSSEDVFAILAEMGAGKTKIVLDEWQEDLIPQGITDLLIVAPKGSITNWYARKTETAPSELEMHLDPRLYGRIAVAAWGRKASSRRRVEWLLTVKTRPRVLFINIEAVSSVAEISGVITRFLAPGRAVFVVDESTKIRRKSSERTKMIAVRLGPMARARRIMTGLVTPRSPLDLYWQFYFLDWRILGFESPIAFRSRYAEVERRCFLHQNVIRAKLCHLTGISRPDRSSLSDGWLRSRLQRIYGPERVVPAETPRHRVISEIEVACDGMPREEMIDAIQRLGGYVQTVEQVKSFKNLEELQKKIEPYTFRVLKKDCLDLAPKIYAPPRYVEMTEEQVRVYKEISEKATSMLDSGHHVTSKMIMDRLMKLHQVVCGHVRDEEGVVRDVDSRRAQEVLEVLEEHSGKAIIWITYDREIRKISEAIQREYGEGSVARFWGGNTKTRLSEERSFLGDDRCRFMCATQGAGGLGNNWTVANLSIYAANSYDLELRAQSEDRNHRKGQKDKVTYVDLMCRGTVEERIIHCLRHKLDLAAQITGENAPEWLRLEE